MRQPIDCIASMTTLDMNSIYMMQNILKIEEKDKLLLLMKIWLGWNKMIDKKADYTYTLENLNDVLTKINECLDIDLTEFNLSKKINSRPHGSITKLELINKNEKLANEIFEYYNKIRLTEKKSNYLDKQYKIFTNQEKKEKETNYNLNGKNTNKKENQYKLIKNGVGRFSDKKFYVNNNFEEIKSKLNDRSHDVNDCSCYLKVNQCSREEMTLINSLFFNKKISGIEFTKNCRNEFPLVNILFFTYDRIEYTKNAIDRLLSSTNYPFNLYIVDNHSTDGTVKWLREIENVTPNIREIVFNRKNRGLAEPTNHFWERVNSDFVGKIDNDTLVPDGWLERLVDAHQKSNKLGVVGGWHFRPEDFNEKDSQNNMYIDNDVQIIEDTHIGGCCYLMKYSIYKKLGPMSFDSKFKIHGWTEYQNKINSKGWKVGYLYPLIQLDYMDDPRSPNCLIEKKYTEYTKKIWKERNIEYSSPEQLIALLSDDAKRVTRSNKELNNHNSKNEYFEFSRPEVQALVNPSSNTILDVGCASGIFGSQIKEKLGAEVWGIEPVKEVGLKAREVIDKVLIGKVEDNISQLPAQHFDSIIFSDVLEHLEDPYAILDLVKDKLSKNGEIIASIPNVRHWSVLKDLLEGKWEYQDAGILDRTHLRFFTKSSILNMFQNAGYKINDIGATQFGKHGLSPKLLNAMSQSGLNVSSLSDEAIHYQYLLKATPLNPLNKKMDDLPLVSIIMLTWNALEYTKKCIESIIKYTQYPYEIIFIDNASTDGTIEYLESMVEENTNFKLIKNNSNKGFAAGNNQGVAAAVGKYVMLLNNDVLVSEDWLSRMVDSLKKHKNIGAIGPVTNYISGRQSYVGQYEGDDYIGFSDFIRKNNKGNFTPRRRLAGFAILMRKDVYDDVEGFDETFGVGNFEDDDLSLKLRSKGFALMVDESVFIHHYGSQTFKANKIDILENLKERIPIFNKKWPDVSYEELLEIKNPLNLFHENLLNKGINKLESSDHIAAEKQFLQILKDNPISEEALYGLALCARLSQNNLKSMEYINTLLKINPEHMDGLNQFGMILVENDNLGQAKSTFITIIERYPNFIEAQRNLAEVFILEEDFDQDKFELTPTLKVR